MPLTNLTIQSLVSLSENDRNRVLETLTDNEADELLTTWSFWARPEQLTPEGDWRIWLILAGRGYGKTRCGSEWVHEQIENGKMRIALVGETKADVRDVMVEGESGILATAQRKNRPLYEPSKRRLTWPNGAIAVCYSGDEPDQLRGPQHDGAWLDELSKYRYAEDTWSNLDLGLRLGENPQVVITTTPRPIKILKELVNDPATHLTKGSTYDNLHNLADSFAQRIIARYEGTRLGRQELHAEILDDIVGALWQRAFIEDHRLKNAPDYFERIVVGVDPAITAGEEADETGIIVCGKLGDRGYIIDDVSGKFSPQEWAIKAIQTYYKFNADRIVAEVNQGGDMVEHTIRTVDKNVAFKAVRASKGKILRAEPIAALYEQGRVHHCGNFAQLEDQLCTYTHETRESPDRLDALVWGLTDLFIGRNEGGTTKVRGL